MENLVKPKVVITPLFRVASVFLVIALTLHVVGFVTPNWKVQLLDDGLPARTGLWRSCWGLVNVNESCGYTNYTTEEWFIAVQILEAFGLACLAIALVITLLLLTIVSNHRLARVNVFICVCAGIFILVGCGIFTWKTKFTYLGYSIWLCWASSLVVLITVIVLECEHHNESTAKKMKEVLFGMVSLEHGKNGYHKNTKTEILSHLQYPHLHPHLHGHLSPHLHGPLNPHLHGHLNPHQHGHLNPHLHGHLNPHLHGHLNPHLHGHLNPHLHGHLNPHLHGHLNPHLHGHLNPHLHGHLNSHLHRHLNTYHHPHLNPHTNTHSDVHGHQVQHGGRNTSPSDQSSNRAASPNLFVAW